MTTIPPSPLTKYRPLLAGGRLIDRHRLIAALAPGRQRRLILIHAPAGFGKTTLAAQWSDLLRAEGRTVAWMSIDRDDDHPVWLLAHLIEAVTSVRPGLTAKLRELLEQHVEDAARHVLPTLINAIDAGGEPLVVVVDDWHRVSDPRALAAMELLLDSACPLLQLVITSRTRTGLPLGRLRLRDQLVEIDELVLRFDPAESEQFLVGVNGLSLDANDVSSLVRTTDGWVAALQLVSLSLRGEPDLRRRIEDLSGRHDSIDAYLAENVLNGLPQPTLDFLLRTALPERLCAELVTALTGEPRGQAMLDQIEAGDLFLRRLDGNHTWFRYHHLFVEFLRRRLERDRPGEVRQLHEQAATWFALKGLTSEAVDHAIAAGDPERAVEMVTDRAMPLFERSRSGTLLALVDKLPRDLAAEQPPLQMALGWAYTLLQRQPEAEQAVQNLERTLRRGATGLDADQVAHLWLERGLLGASFAGHADRFTGLDDIATCLERADELPPWLVTLAACLETFGSLHRFDFAAARRRQTWARPYYQRTGGLLIGGLGLCLGAIAAMEQLDVAGARRQLELALQWGEEGAGRESYLAQMVIGQLGALEYQLGNLVAAERYLEECARFGENGLTEYILPVRVVRPRLKAARGDFAGAEILLAQSAVTAHDLDLGRLTAAVIEEQARLGLESGVPRPAVPELVGGPQDGISIAVADSLDAARIHRALHTGTAAAARDLVPVGRRLLARTEDQHRPLAALRARVLLATLLHRADLAAEARDCLVPALQTCARTGLISPVAEGGAAVAELLFLITSAARAVGRQQSVDDVPNDFLARLQLQASAVTNYHPEATRSAGIELSSGRNDVVTGREMQLLRLLDAGRSNQQIARELHLSTNTVKWYLKALYQKFGVARRQECVAAARSANLLT